jgi:carbon-monoxide dehydrogenase medium subunit
MIPTQFDYVRAKSLREALDAVAGGEGVKVIAGGHSLVPMMKFRLVQPTKLVDIGGIEELRGIAENRKGARIGAMAT